MEKEDDENYEKSALQGHVTSRVFLSSSSCCRDIFSAFDNVDNVISDYIRQQVRAFGGIKFWISVGVQFARPSAAAATTTTTTTVSSGCNSDHNSSTDGNDSDNGDKIQNSNDTHDSMEDATFNSNPVAVFMGHLSGDRLTNDVLELLQGMCRQSEEQTLSHGSGWCFSRVTKITVHTVRHNPLQRKQGHRASSFTNVSSTSANTVHDVLQSLNVNDRSRLRVQKTYLATPNGVRGVLNVRNTDNRCALWCILAKLYPARHHAERVSYYRRHQHKLDMTGVRYPTPVTDMDKIEERNDMSIHVFVCTQNAHIQPLRVAKRVRQDRHVNLLMLLDNNRFHYVLIRSFRLLMNEHLSSVQFCFNCLQRFSYQRALDRHEQHCMPTQQIVFPMENQHVEFRSGHKRMRVPFVIYADFECYNKKATDNRRAGGGVANQSSTRRDGGLSNNEDDKSYARHVPSGFCYIVVSSSEKFSKKPVTYTGENVVETFFDRMLEEEKAIEDILKRKAKIIYTDGNRAAFLAADECYSCGQKFDSSASGGGKIKVRDHDHLTGEYRGAAHKDCNLKMRISESNPLHKFGFGIPIVFHNLRGYDGHLLMDCIGKYKGRKLECIAKSSDKFLTFSTGPLKFIDSLAFLSASLDKLVNNLAKKDSDKFKNLWQEFDKADKTVRELLLRKGVFPYDYFDGESKLRRKSLPKRDKFFNRLKQEECSEQDYAHARKMWTTFKCKTFKDYHNLYMKIDVLQLSDVFENFRDIALETYNLDPAHYLTLASYTWDSMLR